MALNVGQLKNQLQNVFEQRLDSVEKIASRISRAYQAYAVAAQAPPGVPVILLGSESKMLEMALINVMKNRLPAQAAAQMMGNAIMAFWMAPPVMTPSGGAVTMVIPSAGVAKLAVVNVGDSGQAAEVMASSFDMITKTVFVLNPSPLPPGVIF